MAGIAEVLNVGELVSLHWQLGVASQSNHCEELSAPFVRVQLKVKDQNAVITAHSFELNLLEFKV